MAASIVCRDDPGVPAQLFLWGLHGGAWSRAAVRFLSQYSGLPAILVAALLLVVGWRLLRKTLRFFVELAIVTALLFAATRLGWIGW